MGLVPPPLFKANLPHYWIRLLTLNSRTLGWVFLANQAALMCSIFSAGYMIKVYHIWDSIPAQVGYRSGYMIRYDTIFDALDRYQGRIKGPPLYDERTKNCFIYLYLCCRSLDIYKHIDLVITGYTATFPRPSTPLYN